MYHDSIRESEVKKLCDRAMAELVDLRQMYQKIGKEQPLVPKIYLSGADLALSQAINHLQDIFEDHWPVDRCHYCGNVMDGDVCGHDDCPVNAEES